MIASYYDLMPMRQSAQIRIKVIEIIRRACTREITRMDEDVAIGDLQRPMFPMSIGKNNETNSYRINPRFIGLPGLKLLC